jgi:hypothetical protein
VTLVHLTHKCTQWLLKFGSTGMCSMFCAYEWGHVSRLRRLACLYITDPGLPPWASLCRAYGARAIVTLMGEWSICRLAGLASACPLTFTDAMQCASETTMGASRGGTRRRAIRATHQRRRRGI